jgi:hypothetical protein
MCVRVVRAKGMPFSVDVWVEDRDDGHLTIYVDRALISERGARALTSLLTSSAQRRKRLDATLVHLALRAVNN